MAINPYFAFSLECALDCTASGEWRASGPITRPADDLAQTCEARAPEIRVLANRISVRRALVLPCFGLWGAWERLRRAFAGPRHVEDVFAIDHDRAVIDALRPGDVLRVSRDSMGGRHASLVRISDPPQTLWTFDDPPHPMTQSAA